MTALKCILWRRPRKHSVWHQPTMSLAHSIFQRKYRIRTKQQWLKHWFNSRNFYRAALLSRLFADNREMPCLEPLVGSTGDVVPTSPEMPTLVPFTTEHEDPVFKMQDGQSLVRVVGGEKEKYQPVVLLQRLAASSADNDGTRGEFSSLTMEEFHREDGVISPLSLEGFHHQDDWMQWPGEYEGCSCEDIVDIAPGLCFPEIDIIDGVEFLSFLQEEDMNEYSKTHSRSLLTTDAFFLPGSPSSGAASDSFVEDHSRGVIVPTKTKDITQIKGWKRKMFAEDSEDVAGFLGSTPPESPSWMHEEGVATDDIVIEDGPVSCTKPAFVSNSLNEFLKNSSKLRISYLTSYIPNVVPIPSNSPILSIGALSKEGMVPRSELEIAKDTSKGTGDASLVDRICNLLSLEMGNKEQEENDTRISPRSSPVPKCDKEENRIAIQEKLVTKEMEMHEEPSSVEIDKQATPPHWKYQKLIHESVLDSEEDSKKILDFIRSLKTLSRSACELEKTIPVMNFPTISEQSAIHALKALFSTVAKKNETAKVPSGKKRGRKRKVRSEETVPAPIQEQKTPEKRNKRLIRLPARFLDSALIIPGSEGWVSPDLSHSDSGKKYHSPKSDSECGSLGFKLTRSKSAEDDKPFAENLLNGRVNLSSSPAALLPQTENNRVLRTSSTSITTKGKSLEPLKLKHLGQEGRYGVKRVQSLLIVHSSLSMHEKTTDSTVNLPLAAMALNSDSFKDTMDENAPLYLLYGSVDVVRQHQTTTMETKSLDKFFQSASPLVPIVRSITNSVVLQPLPFVVSTVLENKPSCLLVYPVSSCSLDTDTSNVQKPKTAAEISAAASECKVPANSEDTENTVSKVVSETTPLPLHNHKSTPTVSSEEIQKTVLGTRTSHVQKKADSDTVCSISETVTSRSQRRDSVPSEECREAKDLVDMSYLRRNAIAVLRNVPSYAVTHPNGPSSESQVIIRCRQKSAETEVIERIPMVNGFDGTLGDISSIRVLKNSIVVKSSDGVISNRTTNSKYNSVNCRPLPRNGLGEECLQDKDNSVFALREANRRKECREQLRRLHRLLLPADGYVEKIPVNTLVDQAKEHIAKLCADAKKLEEEKSRLLAAHTGLVTAYMQRLETLPVGAQKDALDQLSRQIDIPTKLPSSTSTSSSSLPDSMPDDERKKYNSEVRKVAEAAWNLVGPCSVRRVRLRNGHTVYVYSAHKKDNKAADDNDVAEKGLEEEEGKAEDAPEQVTRIASVGPIQKTSLWVSEVGEPCYVTQLDPDEDKR